MKFKKTLLASLLLAFGMTAVACNKGDGGKASELTIWVGSESEKFYQTKMNEYVAAHENGPKSVKVVGVDTGSSADTFLADTEAGADIFVVAHDNLGKLLDGAGSIEPVKSEALLDQMAEQNAETFLDVCYLAAGDGSDAQFYAVPVMSQALVLYYDKRVFTEDKLDKLASWEGILEVAKANDKKATAWTGSDGFNFSSFLLAKPESEDAITAFGKNGTLELYQSGDANKNMGYGDDQVAIFKYAQRFITDKNGRNGTLISDNGFAKELKSQETISFIGGAWHSGAAEAALGKDNVGVTILPSFTLTEADAYGKAKAGMKFHSGSFYDAKVMVKKKNSAYAEYLDDILSYLSSDEVQKASYETCNNLPASKNVELKADDQLASAQVEQGNKWGMAQPFGFNPKFNGSFYSKGAPDIYVGIVQNKKGVYGTDAKILKGLQTASYIWAKNKQPSSDEKLEAWVNR